MGRLLTTNSRMSANTDIVINHDQLLIPVSGKVVGRLALVPDWGIIDRAAVALDATGRGAFLLKVDLM